MEFKNWHLKGSKHTGLCSFLSPYHWRWIASHDLAVDRCIPLCLKTSGLSSRAEPPERLAVVWHAPCFLPAQQQQPARLPSFPAHLLACQPRCALWELGLAVLVTGLRWTADGAFCPSAPRGQVERVRETGVFMFHLLPPPPHPLLHTHMPWHWFLQKTGENQKRGKKNKPRRVWLGGQ